MFCATFLRIQMFPPSLMKEPKCLIATPHPPTESVWILSGFRGISPPSIHKRSALNRVAAGRRLGEDVNKQIHPQTKITGEAKQTDNNESRKQKKSFQWMERRKSLGKDPGAAEPHEDFRRTKHTGVPCFRKQGDLWEHPCVTFMTHYGPNQEFSI